MQVNNNNQVSNTPAVQQETNTGKKKTQDLENGARKIDRVQNLTAKGFNLIIKHVKTKFLAVVQDTGKNISEFVSKLIKNIKLPSSESLRKPSVEAPAVRPTHSPTENQRSLISDKPFAAPLKEGYGKDFSESKDKVALIIEWIEDPNIDEGNMSKLLKLTDFIDLNENTISTLRQKLNEKRPHIRFEFIGNVSSSKLSSVTEPSEPMKKGKIFYSDIANEWENWKNKPEKDVKDFLVEKIKNKEISDSALKLFFTKNKKHTTLVKDELLQNRPDVAKWLEEKAVKSQGQDWQNESKKAYENATEDADKVKLLKNFIEDETITCKQLTTLFNSLGKDSPIFKPFFTKEGLFKAFERKQEAEELKIEASRPSPNQGLSSPTEPMIKGKNAYSEMVSEWENWKNKPEQDVKDFLVEKIKNKDISNPALILFFAKKKEHTNLVKDELLQNRPEVANWLEKNVNKSLGHKFIDEQTWQNDSKKAYENATEDADKVKLLKKFIEDESVTSKQLTTLFSSLGKDNPIFKPFFYNEGLSEAFDRKQNAEG